MTSIVQENQAQNPEQPKNDKEYNFRQLEQKLQQERTARIEAERIAQDAERRVQEATIKKNLIVEDDEENYSEPYVEPKYLQKKLSKFEKQIEEKIDRKAEEKARQITNQKEQEHWLKTNSDFYDLMQKAEQFAHEHPVLAESILRMPEGFERQKLVYTNLKALGYDKPKENKPSIQDKIDANKRSPYYQPSGVGNAPYAMAGDFSDSGKKQAYQKMQELKSKLRM
jgi:hypothetical protein